MSNQLISGWGRYPVVEAEMAVPARFENIDLTALNSIARGMGRSYGDSALATQIISTQQLDNLIAFNGQSGELRCAGGTTLEEILKVFVPRGWFLSVTPGTKFVSVGGAIASDVHGKNHHKIGSFCDHVTSIELLIGSGEMVSCSPQQNSDLFRATCGGMGLTGIIVSATIKLLPIQSTTIRQQTLKAANIKEVFQLFEANRSATYSVAWIDCLASGNALGRSLLYLGEHDESGTLDMQSGHSKSIPFDMPTTLLNRFTIQAFNTLYYHKVCETVSQQQVHYEPYFYPLDSIHHWNRLYGRRGFLQYQFVLPKTDGLEGMTKILQRISASKKGSFLAVLKELGAQNKNLLSFPIEGYTLALDFKWEPDLLQLLNELDQIVLEYGGRIYLTKDARMSETTFKQSYPSWEQFMEIRHKYGATEHFNSLQSERLGL
ncbi:MAG: FAD-binding oxidoreductase [Gammaproteobacteria bacterium]|nr:FAD-binding oxidoreductase [Gammaproteobacteria bacterium]